MKKYKKQLLSLFLVLLFLVSATGCGGQKGMKEIHTLAGAKSDYYGSAEELASEATVVLRAEKTEKEENVAKNLGTPDAWHGYTISMVQVKDVMKNTSGQEMAVGDEIPILENQFTYTDSEGANVTCHIEQYQMMEPGNEYFLYLYYSEHDEWFVILSGLLGKVPVSEDEDVLFPSSRITYFRNQQEEEENSDMQKLLKRIREESLVMYADF